MEKYSAPEANSSNFNDEIIWDNTKDLFDIYFRQIFLDNRHRISTAPADDKKTFEQNVEILKKLK
jgi:hypothetical protein